MTEVRITQTMREVREDMQSALLTQEIPTDVVEGLAHALTAMTYTLGLTDTQRGWMVLAVANLLSGIGVAGMAVGENEGFDPQVTRLGTSLLSSLVTVLCAAGDRIITSDELPAL